LSKRKNKSKENKNKTNIRWGFQKRVKERGAIYNKIEGKTNKDETFRIHHLKQIEGFLKHQEEN
jgi:hypothetical protein